MDDLTVHISNRRVHLRSAALSRAGTGISSLTRNSVLRQDGHLTE